MIASPRGLAVLVALTVALAIAVVVDVARTPAPVDRAVVPGFVAERVMYLRWTAPELQVRRDSAGWTLCTDATAGDLVVMMCHGWTADAGAVDTVLAALRGGRWHRREQARVAGAVARTLVVGLGGPTVEVGLAAPVEGADQRWIVVGRDALLVDGWIARTLFPERDTLIDRDVFPGSEGAPRIEVGQSEHFHISIDSGCRAAGVWVDPARCDQLHQALAAVKVDTIASGLVGPDLAAPYVRYRTRGGREHHAGQGTGAACGTDRVAVFSDAGGACVAAAAWRAVFAAAEPLAGPPQAIVDRRPLPIAPAKLDRPGGVHLDVTALSLDGKDADRDQVSALLAALATPAEVVPVPAAKPTATITATDRAGTTVTLDLVGDVIVRRGEPVALRPSREALATITRPASALLDPTRWVEDPLVVAELVIDGVTYRRGAVVGEWTREPAGPFDPAAVEALATALARVRAPAVPAAGPPVHRVTVKLAPPVGTPASHVLEIDRRCAARLDGAPVQLDPATCAAVEKIRDRSATGPH